jgi:hypothetical protein
MLRVVFSSLFFLASLSVVRSGTIVIEGKYQNKNLYIQNSLAENGVGFCAYEVTINGQVTTDEVASNTFEIDFSALPIEPGSHVVVEIKHKNDCAPKILNPDALKPEPTFEITNIKIDKNGLLNWSTQKEIESLPFIIEQFRWNKWIKVGEIKGEGKSGVNNYMFQMILHSGENKIRIKQVGFSGIERVSKPVVLKSDLKPLQYKITKDKKDIEFSKETLFEVYDMYGNVVKYGYGSTLSTASLPKGAYFLCYDNAVADFTK